MSISLLEPPSLVWWYSLIWCRCVFYLKGDYYIWPILIFTEQYHIIFVGFFLKICNPLPYYPKDECILWFYSIQAEAEFNGTKKYGTNNWLGNTSTPMYTFCILSVIKYNQKMGWHLVHWVTPVRGEIIILAAWIFCTKGINIVSTNHLMKRRVEALTY